MTPKELIMQVSCPSCGAMKNKRCVSVKTGEYLNTTSLPHQHNCHIARVKLHKKRGRPVQHDNWPVTRLKV